VITLDTLALKVGLTKGTVSQILSRDDPRYSAATRRRVHAVARELRYRPNLLTRALARGKSQRIGVVRYDLRSPVYMTWVAEMSECLEKDGYQTVLAGYGRSEMPERDMIEGLLAWRVDGLIVFSEPGSDRAFYRELRHRGVALVVIEESRASGRLPWLALDVPRGMYLATRHVLALGHRDIALAFGDYTLRIGPARLVGVRRAFKDVHARIRENRVMHGRATPEVAYEFTRKQVTLGKPPTAILYNNDELALAGLHALREKGLRVPEDVSVVGYDDIPSAAYACPPLTTVRHPRALAKQAVQMLLAQVKDEPAPRLGELAPELVARRSTAPAKGGSGTVNRKGKQRS
jgi:LacI family transcriptional regulator